MTKRQILSAAKQFRDAILSGRSSRLMCFAICTPLQGWLSCCGVETELVEADFGYVNHVWLKLPSGEILDPTADQFGLAPVYIGPMPEQYVTLMQNK